MVLRYQLSMQNLLQDIVTLCFEHIHTTNVHSMFWENLTIF